MLNQRCKKLFKLILYILAFTVFTPSYLILRNKFLAHHGICSPDDRVNATLACPFCSYETALNFSQWLANPGGVVTLEGFSGAQNLSTKITEKANVTILLGNTQIKCAVAPCISLNSGSRLIGQNGVLGYPNLKNPYGSIIWENSTSTNALINCATGTNPACFNTEIAHLALANVTALNNTLACSNSPVKGIGLDWTYFVFASLHDVDIQCFDTGIHASYSYYNNWARIGIGSFGTSAINADVAFNENTLTQISMMNPMISNSYGLYATGGGSNSVRDIDAENWTNGSQIIVNLTSTTAGWYINGVAYQESLGGASLYSDSSTAMTSTSFGNTICLEGPNPAGYCQEINSVPVKTNDLAANGVATVVSHQVISKTSGQHITPGTVIYNVNFGSAASVFLLVWELGTPGGGSGTETVTLTNQLDPVLGNPNSCAATISLSGGATTTSGICPITFTENTSYSLSLGSAGGSGTSWKMGYSLLRVH